MFYNVGHDNHELLTHAGHNYDLLRPVSHSHKLLHNPLGTPQTYLYFRHHHQDRPDVSRRPRRFLVALGSTQNVLLIAQTV